MAASGNACMASERETEEFSVPLPDKQHATLQARWGLGNQLFVYAADKTPALLRGDSGSVTQQGCDILDVRWGQDLHCGTLRKLINESHSIFVMLQGQVTSLTGPALCNQLKEVSRQYRSIIKAGSLELQLMLSDTKSDEGEMEYLKNQLELLETMQIVWSLCEILFIDISPGEMVLVQLLNWIRWHFPEGIELARDVIKEENPEEHPAYWEAVFRLLLQGEIERVRKLLSLHSCRHTQPFVNVDELLKRMPQWENQHSASLAEFDLKWQHWRDECIQRFEEGHFTAFSQLDKVVQILCGDALVFVELNMCETWYHLLISQLLYQNPTVRPTDLAFHVHACMEEFQRSGHRLGAVDNILQAALEFDLHQVIKDSSACLGDRSWWFVAHLTDILHHCGQIDSQKLPFGSNLREYLLLEYVTCLMSHNSLWQVGIDYLDYCPVFGKEQMKLYIESIPLDSERKANKLIHICEERDLLEQVQSICKTMGVRCTHNGRLGSALTWFLRSKDVPSASRLTEKLLEEYKEHGSFSHLDLLDHMGPTMLLTQQLTFLGKYREFHRLYQEKDVKGAASLLLNLLTARAAPRHFWVTLLMDALPLLETPQVVLGSSQTYELMHCLEELTQELSRTSTKMTPVSTSALHGKIDTPTQTVSQSDHEKLQYLRLALCRNLSRAIVHEGTIVPA